MSQNRVSNAFRLFGSEGTVKSANENGFTVKSQMPFGFLVLRGCNVQLETESPKNESQMPFGFLVLRGATSIM